jgi:hypothetical protein
LIVVTTDTWMCVHVQVSGRKFHVLLTSYELLMGAQDRPRLGRIHWGGIVVDEGHRCVGVGMGVQGQLACKLPRDGVVTLLGSHPVPHLRHRQCRNAGDTLLDLLHASDVPEPIQTVLIEVEQA